MNPESLYGGLGKALDFIKAYCIKYLPLLVQELRLEPECLETSVIFVKKRTKKEKEIAIKAE